GLHACLAAGIAMTNEIPQLQAQGELLSVDLSILKRWQIDYDELLQQVQHGSPSVQLWDCRSEDEYLGERMAARRAGHIPTALHYDWCQLFCRERQLKLYPLAEIQQQLQQRGFDLSQPVVVYCQSHHRSSLAYVVARLLHWSVRAYDGAWSEWGNESHSPIHSGAEP
ncbi:MAG: rhodanese-like domain-containing protein, partial [Acinetobacter sp.]|nr:rhodanese-like domain-containing protein [Acinetobacter sp.]